eukprot:SAG22_NODE_3019_length_2021_cov_1.065557_2_plen_41_part_00
MTSAVPLESLFAGEDQFKEARKMDEMLSMAEQMQVGAAVL